MIYGCGVSSDVGLVSDRWGEESAEPESKFLFSCPATVNGHQNEGPLTRIGHVEVCETRRPRADAHNPPKCSLHLLWPTAQDPPGGTSCGAGQ